MARKPGITVIDKKIEKVAADQRKNAEEMSKLRAQKRAIRDARLLAVGRLAERSGIADFSDSNLLAAFKAIAAQHGAAVPTRELATA